MNGWLSKVKLTINSSEVPAVATDLPIILVASNLPSEIMATSGGCADDGGDIRFSSDDGGLIELPRQIISIDKVGGILTMYVKIPSISSTVDTDFYMWWNNPNAGEPSETGDSGSRTCWSEYYGVFHYKDIVDTWKGIPDASGSWSAQSVIGVSSTSEGHVEGTTCVNLGTEFGITLHEDITFNGGVTNDLMFWVNFNGSHSTGNLATGFNGIPFGWMGAGQFGTGWGNFSTSTNAVPSTGWHHVWVRNVAGTANSYVDGVQKTQTTTTTAAEQFKTWGLGSSTAPTWDCSEMRMTRGNNIDISTVQVMVSNESDPASFVTPGTPETSSVSYSLTMTGLEVATKIKIYNSSTGLELAGVDSSTDTFTWDFSHSGNFDVNIHIHNSSFDFISFVDYTVTAENITFPIQQQFARYKL